MNLERTSAQILTKSLNGMLNLLRGPARVLDLLSIQKKTTTDETENGTALHSAVQMGNSVMAQALIESRTVWVDEEDGKGRTALHYSMEQCSTELASVLLKGGANVDCVDFQGTSACHLACQEGMIDAFNLLLYYRADVCAIDKAGKTPFDLACEYGQDKMVESMMTCGLGLAPFMKAGSSHKASALHLAARNGHTHICLRLLEAGWDLNKMTSVGSALHEAAGNGRAQVVRFLLHAGIDTALTSPSGQSALDAAKKNAHRNPITIKEIRFLLKENKKFVYAEAIRDHIGVRADELSFSKGDLIWIIDHNCNKEGRDKGIIFGQKANSRSGLFDGKTVKVVDRPPSGMSLQRPKKNAEKDLFKSATLRPNRGDNGNKKLATVRRMSVVGMSNRMSMNTMQSFGPPQERKPKRFDIPVVPKVPVTNNTRNAAVVDMNRNLSGACSYRSVNSPSRMSDDRDSQNGNRRPLNSFGTEAPLTFGKPVMTSVQYASTSSIPLAESHRISTGSNCSQGSSGFESMKNGTSASSSASSFHTTSQHQATNGDQGRNSGHSSGGSAGSGPSSLASCSVDALDDSFGSGSPYESCLDVTSMVSRKVPEAEILAIWLDKMNMSEYLSLFLTQGYDLSTIARITPEDLNNVGVTNPDHRKMLILEIHSWNITDSWPKTVTTGGLKSWLEEIGLPEYVETFHSQRYNSLQEVLTLEMEDLEDVGIKRLGHLKRIQLAAKKIRDHRITSNQQPLECQINGIKYVQAPIQVHSPRMQARPMDFHRDDVTSPRMHDPPPPAPSSFRGGKPLNGGIDYFSYTRGRNAPLPPQRNDDYASYMGAPQRQYNNNVRGNYNTYCDVPDLGRKREPLRLNFYGNGQILSEASDAGKDNMSLMGSTTNLDFPPAPAPLAIDSSIRRLQDACASSASIGSISSGSSFDIPFANENCGTIRARDMRPSMETSTMGISIPTPTNAPLRPPILKNSAPKESVLNSIGTMFDSLTAELDDLLEPYNKQKQQLKN